MTVAPGFIMTTTQWDAVQAELAELRAEVRRGRERACAAVLAAYEDGRDSMAADVIQVLTDMTDKEPHVTVLDAVWDMANGRLRLAGNQEEWFCE